MSVRATERLIGDLVTVSAIPNSPNMVVQSVEIDAKLVVTTWFSKDNEYQEGCFPASALDRVELKAKPAAKSTAKAASKPAKKPAGRPAKKAKGRK